jgi:hypothetical protein
MDETEAAKLLTADGADKTYLTVRQAAFIVFTTLIHEPASMATLLGCAGAQHRPGLRVETQPPSRSVPVQVGPKVVEELR